MANHFIKAERLVRTGLGVLEREVVLPSLMWRNAGGDFKGAKNDTISLRVPAYTRARTRTLRSGTLPLVVDELGETKVDITLDTDIYKTVGVSLEELTLDIESFEEQVALPVLGSMVRGLEDAVAAEVNAANTAVDLAIDEDDPYPALIDARLALNDAGVPMSGRWLAVGTNIEGAILKSDRLSKFDQSGSSEALREASMGKIAGFQAVSVPGLDPDLAVAGHSTAFPMSVMAPAVPQGAIKGAVRTYNGFALTVIQDYDSLYMKDRFGAHLFAGVGTTLDRGYFDNDGKWVAVTNEDITTQDGKAVSTKMIRAVKLGLNGQQSA